MSTRNIRRKVEQSMAEEVDGVTGRWTYFTRLRSRASDVREISSSVFAIDSREELKLGIGRLFEPKKVIGERETIISQYNLEILRTQVGEQITLHYDIKLILNMIQRLSGEIFPSFLTKETSLAELQNEARRKEIAWELAQFFVQQTLQDDEMDSTGSVNFDFEQQLQTIAASPEETREILGMLLEGQGSLIQSI